MDILSLVLLYHCKDWAREKKAYLSIMLVPITSLKYSKGEYTKTLCLQIHAFVCLTKGFFY